MSLPQVWVLHGPNLNLLGEREPEIYGHQTLETLNQALKEQGNLSGLLVDCYQSNHEGELIDKIHQIRQEAKAMIINPAGLTHTSVALRDALVTCHFPIIEVHLSNIYQREYFRHHSYISPVVLGVISGLGTESYYLALEALNRYFSKAKEGSARMYGH